MKNLMILFCVIAVLLFLFLGIKSQQESNDVGRYQLIQVKYEVLILKEDEILGNSEKNTAFRIDTKTGKTWRYSEGIFEYKNKKLEPKTLSKWIEIGK